ncbi:hypothetical protein ERO13_A01G128500v2 [Gossypium hirsutum]|uniref:Exocyst subunit Exo70 family protein n=1 Tax=Gossypium hirsutum TaxID=3635 RepID=A0A1U8KGZ3_GOSHI|nr:exocyst complex component EXO70B1 [Gossypium hirsutum]KAG4214561.1 hypothetical protein ERO13_A01G128500v2 [Gossypium hirsutum]
MNKRLNSEKSGSFPRFGRRRSKRELETGSFKLKGLKPKVCGKNQNPVELFWKSDLNHDEILEKVVQFIEKLASGQYKSKAPEIPNFVESFFKMAESRIATYEQSEASAKLGFNEKHTSFFEAISCLSKIVNTLDEFQFDSATTSCFNRAESVHHRAMLLSEYQFLALLEISKRNCNVTIDSKTPKTPKQSFFNFNQETDRCVKPEYDSRTEIVFPYFPPQSVANMNRVALAMISAGYEEECFIVYSGLRLKALDFEFSNQGYENVNMEDFQSMDWESMEGEIDNWIHIVKYCTTNLFSVERKLCNSVFPEHSLIAQKLFCDLATSLTIRLLNFPNAFVLIKQYSAEKLFKFLDIYETLRDLTSSLGTELPALDLISETSETQRRVGEAAVTIFCQLENSIKSDNGRIPVASGAVHPLTRYTMNYLKYACEYKDTLQLVFQQHYETEGSTRRKVQKQESKNAIEDNGRSPKTSHFSVKLMMVMDLLDAKIEMKSKFYRDPALRYIFLMNNGRYILQKIKGSTDIDEIMGPSWSGKRTSDLRQYHKNYQRETWRKVLQCLNHEGLQINGKVSKAILKGRFKNFNTLFDEIRKTQSIWMVSDEQLKSELRVSISAVVIPAYRSFLGRFKSHFDSDKKAEKYIKHQPEDIEGLIDTLFEGNMTSMGRRRHNN